MLREYQQKASDLAFDAYMNNALPSVVTAYTAAGKSHIIADLARRVHSHSGKRVLSLQPSKELVQQNYNKFLTTGNPASIFCGSITKDTRHPVVFATPQSVVKSLDKFKHNIALVIHDECHRTTPTHQRITGNVDAVEIGLTATPYRLGSGYIYAYDCNNNPMCDLAINPHYNKELINISGRYLLDNGYITPFVFDPAPESYDTSLLQLQANGRYSDADIDRAFHGHGRLTSKIVADIVERSMGRKKVLIFAATLQHCKEVLASLPPQISAIVDSKTKGRNEIIKEFQAGRLKYLVNKDILTTGFDDPEIDHIAFLRLSESVSLIQQMAGRGGRLHPDKKDCLISDYAGNIERHCPDGDIYNPAIDPSGIGKAKKIIDVECPKCHIVNHFRRRSDDNAPSNEFGYLIDLDGNPIKSEYGDIPSHFGRKCQAEQGCDYRWTSKQCPSCGVDNDIAAKYCVKCKQEIVDPNEKLRLYRKNLDNVQIDPIVYIGWQKIQGAKNMFIKADVKTDMRTFVAYLFPYMSMYRVLEKTAATSLKTVTYQKKGKYFNIMAFNQKPYEATR
jgi:DNA repair protein RadD